MTRAVSEDVPKKRKRTVISEKSNKRAKAEQQSSGDEENPQDGILLLEKEILESRKNYNNIATLLDLARDSNDVETSLFATISLGRVFLRLLASGSLKPSDEGPKKKVVGRWLKDRLGDYKEILVSLLGQEEPASTALTLALRILKSQSQNLSDKPEYNFPRTFLRDIVRALLHSTSEDVRQEFCEDFVGKHADVRFYTFKTLKEILAEPSSKDSTAVFDRAFDMLAFFEDVPESVDDLGDCYAVAPPKKQHPIFSLNQQKRQVQEAWLALFNTEPDRDQRKRVLEIMTRSVVPWFVKPELLMDFLTDSYNSSGGSIPLLALSGVFYLIQERNLDYPSFYRKLFSLLDADILHSRHRSKFFRLLSTFMASTHLPAALIASFVKRLSRLCLNAPPGAIVVVIPWIFNVLQKHPQCTFMIHRELRSPAEKAAVEDEGMDDPFDPDEEDPMETRAIDSCLWEIVQLQSHFHPNVATIAKIISEPFTKQAYNLDDFRDHSYISLLETEMGKQVKKPPAVEFMIPKRVFLPQDPASGVEDTILTRLWDFS